MKASDALSLLLLFLFPLSLFSQKYGDYKWHPKPDPVEVPSDFAGEDAVIVQQDVRYTIRSYSVYEYGYFYTKYTRTKVQTKDGIITAGRIAVPNFGSNIVTIDARTIKPNGKIVDLKAEDIKELDVNVDEQDVLKNERLLLFSVPGVEVGDEVEVVYIIEDIPAPYQVFLHDELPIMQSNYILTLPRFFKNEIYTLNGMPKPDIQLTQENSTMVLTWTLENLKGIGDQPGIIKSLELPYITQITRGIQVTKDVYLGEPEDITWSYYFEDIEESFKQEKKYVSKKYGNAIEEFVEPLTQGMADTAHFAKMLRIHDFINKNIEIVRMDKKEAMKHIGYHLENSQMEGSRMLNLYAHIFETAGIPYYLIFAKDKYNGLINANTATINQVDYLLFGFEDGLGKMHFVIPKISEITFAIDELPASIQGTIAVSLQAKGKWTNTITLPYLETADNARVRKVQARVDLSGNKLTQDFSESLSGCHSSIARHSYLSCKSDQELLEFMTELMEERCQTAVVNSVSIDTAGGKYPAPFQIKYQLQYSDIITKLDEQLYSISFEDWFWHSYDEVNPESRWLSYFPLFGRQDIFKYYLMFDEDVELVNGDALEKNSINQKIGGYLLSVKQLNPRVILMESQYVIGGGEVQIEDVMHLAEIHKELERADNEPLVIKTLKTN